MKVAIEFKFGEKQETGRDFYRQEVRKKKQLELNLQIHQKNNET